jgi:hypothetical protein
MKIVFGIALLFISFLTHAQSDKHSTEKTPIVVSSQPLYIVDGIKKSKLDINPENIEKMEVVKKEVAIALYGEDGRNGAIIVTTKKRSFKK